MQPVQCFEGTAEGAAASNLMLCLPEDTITLEVAASSQEAPAWTWLQESGMAEVAPLGGRPSQVLTDVTGTATLAQVTGSGEMLLVMDSSEDSVGLAAKGWFNDSVIATQALLTLEARK